VMIGRFWKWYSAYRYELIAVLNGAIIMVLEIVGARIIAPPFGSSVYVWTAVIGVILGALSLGYWYGGKMADRGASDRGLAVILVLAAAVLLMSLLTREVTLALAVAVGGDIRLQALAAAVILFGPANFLMGTVSPYLAKLRIANLATAGASVGRLYAAGTLGSIVGTFAAGYWLIAVLGNRALGLWLVVGLIVASLMAERRRWVWQRTAVAVAVGVLMVLPRFEQARAGQAPLLYDGDSTYARWQVLEVPYKGQPARLITSDWNAVESGMFVNEPGRPAFDYIERFLNVAEAMGGPRRVLVIGGGTYTLPRMLLERYPGTMVDVVEIDPKLDELAAHFFGYKPDPRVRVIHEDGRTFLNGNQEVYDVVFIDAFASTVPPFQLTTVEAVERVARSLAPDGVVAVNLIAAQAGAGAAFAQAEAATYRARFAQVAVAPAVAGSAATARQNLILMAGRHAERVQTVVNRFGTGRAEVGPGPVLTDDFAPVEQMMIWR
jgi:predicted O-methyltransferase YrrM